MVKCPKCSTENLEGLTFCGQCGAKLERICPKCNVTNPAEFGFCGQCGQSLYSPGFAPKKPSVDEIAKIQRYLPKDLTQEILAQRGKIEGEQKQVTVMFCDMEGFTSLTEKLGSEETYSLMKKVYEILGDTVNDPYEGTVNELTGDGIMALFGAPIALEDAPQRAIRSAFAIHQEINKFSDRIKREKGIPKFKMRIGIHTGPVVVGTLGNDLRVEFKAVGDTVNLASRMEALAEPGTTYVTDDTYKLTRDLFHFEPLGEKEVKGKKQPVAVYKLVSAIQDVYRPRLGSERRIYSKMVGRDKQLDDLEERVRLAIKGQGSVVNIFGEAGIGKSRLVAELKKREMMKKIKPLEGRAISIGENLSFHPITDLLKQWTGISQDDDQEKAFKKLGSLFPAEVGEVFPFVATLMGIPLSGNYAERVKRLEGEALEKLILKSLRDLLIKAAKQTPLMIVMEDLHWADTSSLQLLESLFRLAATQRILFVNLFRRYFPAGERILKTVRERLPAYYLEMELEPLKREESEKLISNMLGIC
jgi:class 3 adenylate cyclase